MRLSIKYFADLVGDAKRRDLTVNAMAMDCNGKVVDPFGGKEDVKNKVLRHVSPAFADDPLRVLRVARFLARFGPEWTVAEETKGMCSLLSETGELDNLTNERVWKEMSRAMMERNPELFFEFLQEVGALEKVLPEVAQLAKAKENLKWHPEGNAFAHTMLVLKQAVVHNGDLELRLAALCHDLGKGTTPVELMELGKHHGHETRSVYLTRDMMKRLGQGGRLVKRLEKVSRFHMHMHKLETLNPKTFVKMFNEMDALRDPDVVRLLFDLGCCDSRGRLGAELEQPYAHHLMLFEAFEAFESVNFKSVFGDEVVKDGNKVKTRLDKARLDAVKEWKKGL